jgi:arylsulfatase A-like enzyme
VTPRRCIRADERNRCESDAVARPPFRRYAYPRAVPVGGATSGRPSLLLEKVLRALTIGSTVRALLLACVFAFSAAEADEPRGQVSGKPNIVFILADNLGWGELGVYGGGILRGAATPRIDHLAAEGLRLLNYNVEVSCSPTRSDLMTGRFAVRSGTTRSAGVTERFGLVDWEITIAELLSKQGYATALFGKWHLGNEQGRYPNDRGFDEWYGIPRTTNEALNGTSPGYDPRVVKPEYVLAGRAGEPTYRVKEYTMPVRRQIDTELTSRAIEFIRRNAAATRRFYLYLPLTQVHYPTIPSAAFAGRTENGDFADSLAELDYHVGEILDAIDRAGVAENTIVIFASDNGPEYRRPWRGTAGYWRGTYHTALEGSLRVPFIIRWPGRIRPRVSNEIVHAVDMFNTLAGAGGAQIPTDRPIDGVDQLGFFTGVQSRSAREGFPIYIEDKLVAVKWRNWKYYTVWQPDPEEKAIALPKFYLFNLIVDPKEESPRSSLEDGWLNGPITGVIKRMTSSLAEYPPIPFGAPKSYVPRVAAAAPKPLRSAN